MTKMKCLTSLCKFPSKISGYIYPVMQSSSYILRMVAETIRRICIIFYLLSIKYVRSRRFSCVNIHQHRTFRKSDNSFGNRVNKSIIALLMEKQEKRDTLNKSIISSRFCPCYRVRPVHLHGHFYMD